MNKKRITGIIILLLIGGLYLLFSRHPSESESSRATSRSTIKKAPISSKTSLLELDDDGAQKPEGLNEADWKRAIRVHSIKKSANRKISFYGKIIDQNGDPVQGVNLEIRLIGWQTSFLKYLSTGKTQEKEILNIKTDSNGMFEIEKKRGTGLKIEKMKKKGYLRAGRGIQYSFSYSNLSSGPDSSMYHHPNKNKPVVFTMWKKGKTEPLINRGMQLSFKSLEGIDTMFVKLDPRSTPSPRLVKGWDIKVEAHRQSDNDWILRLTANGNGGFLKTSEIFANLAPTTGYTKSLVFKLSDKKNPMQLSFTKYYYRANNSRLYARIILSYADYMKGKNFSVKLGLKINPSGSRNLEYDESKRIKSR